MRLDNLISTPKKYLIGIILIFIISLLTVASASAATITITAKPSAESTLPYKNFTKTWYNYCPLCGECNILIINPKKTFEGELTCLHCGADYCAVTGKDKNHGGSRAQLILFEDLYSKNSLLWSLLV